MVDVTTHADALEDVTLANRYVPSGQVLVTCDYSALEMRIVAALAVRAQRQILDAYNYKEVPQDVTSVIANILDNKVSLDAARSEELQSRDAYEIWKSQEPTISNTADVRERYRKACRELARTALLASFQRCLKEVWLNIEGARTKEWSPLRDALNVPGMDVHTWTALRMDGRDAKALFSELQQGAVVPALKGWKKELGERRQWAKVCNMYLPLALNASRMVKVAKTLGIQWSNTETEEMRLRWLAAYPEVDLWQKWTELNAGRDDKDAPYTPCTLDRRVSYAMDLKAALTFEIQGTAAGLTHLAIQALGSKLPDVAKTFIEPLQGQLTLLAPSEKAEEYAQLVQNVMSEWAQAFLTPYGVRNECITSVSGT